MIDQFVAQARALERELEAADRALRAGRLVDVGMRLHECLRLVREAIAWAKAAGYV